MTTIYLAGPDVFLSDALSVLNTKKQLLEDVGFKVITPLDTESDNPDFISRENELLIYQANIVVADVQPFRGTEPDSGTVYEIGYAKALGKDVITYNNPRKSYKERLEIWDDIHAFGCNAFHPEPFGLKQNLMISCSAKIELRSFDDVLEFLKTHYGR